jgi:hypothetical protein
LDDEKFTEREKRKLTTREPSSTVALTADTLAATAGGGGPDMSPIPGEGFRRRHSGTMYVGRDDTAAGAKGKAAQLTKLPGGAAEAKALAARALKLAALLRIKIEDDGDIQTAEEALDNCQAFFADLQRVSQALGHSSAFAALALLRGRESSYSGT